MSVRLSDRSCPECGSPLGRVEIRMPDGVDFDDEGLYGAASWICTRCGKATRMEYRAAWTSLRMRREGR